MKKTFGSNLKAIREINGFTQKQLANLLNTTQQRISEWENGKIEPTLFNLLRIIKILNVTFEELTEDIELN